MSGHCGGQCGTCRKMGGGSVFSQPYGAGTGDKRQPPVNFPSPLQARLAVGDPGVGGVPHQPRATKAVQVRSTMGQGAAAGEVTGSRWRVPMPNWGSVSAIRWRHLIANPGENRRALIDYLPFRFILAPLWDQTARVRRKQYPPLDERTYNFSAVTSADVLALARARAAARAKR